MIRRPLALAVAGVAAFLLFMLALLPARVALRFVPEPITVAGLEGSVWRGRAANIAWRGQALGAVEWSSRFWRLPLLELNYALRMRPPGGDLSLDVVLRPDERLDLRDIRGTLPVATLEGFLSPAGWTGDIEFDAELLELRAGRPVSASGTLLARNLAGGAGTRRRIGDFELLLGEGQVGAEGISGRLRDLENGPLRVRATVNLEPSGRYVMSGEVASTPDADPSIQQSLQYLGPPDTLGRRRFTLEGTF